MKVIYALLLFILFASCASGKGKAYIGSTPANDVVRSFLGIPLSDSVDFIRWWIATNKEKINLKCNYGIGKPNTNGFINNGKWIEAEGILKRENNYYHILVEGKELIAIEVNPDLIHLLDKNKKFLVGNGGWSYVLNAESPLLSNQVNIISKQETLKDSMTYQGRTLCSDFSINHPGKECIKMKWLIVFYADAKKGQPTTYLLNRNQVSKGKTGTWKIITGKDGRIIYELKTDTERAATYLLKLDNDILQFTDAQGNLLVGNEDFSFTLNRK